MNEKRTDIYGCPAWHCDVLYDDASELIEHIGNIHVEATDGWRCGNCGGFFDFEQDARECCRDGYPAS